MKKVIVAFLIIVFFAACGSSSGDDITSGADTGTDTATPSYQLSIKGSINKMEDASGNVTYLGEIQNTGTGKSMFHQDHLHWL